MSDGNHGRKPAGAPDDLVILDEASCEVDATRRPLREELRKHLRPLPPPGTPWPPEEIVFLTDGVVDTTVRPLREELRKRLEQQRSQAEPPPPPADKNPNGS